MIKLKKEYSFDFVPCHNAYCQIIFSTRKEKIELYNNGNYFECELPLSDDLYDLYTNGTYAFSDYSIDEYPAKVFLDSGKYKYELKNRTLNEIIYYDYDSQKLVILFEHCSELNNHVLFPVGLIINKDKSRNIINLKDVNSISIKIE